jgi:protein Tex
VGDIVKVWVVEIDKTRRRVSLTMIAPGTPRHAPQRASGGEARESRPPRGRRPPRQRHAGAGAPNGSPTQPTDQTDSHAAGGAPAIPAAAETKAPSPTRSTGTGSGIRPPHTGGKPQHRRNQGRQHQHHRAHSGPKPKPKPLIPITKEMIEGKEPLRTFSDLLQFCQHQEEPKETAPASATASAQKVTSAQQPGEHQPRNIESGLKDTSNGAQETEAANQTGSNATEPHAAAN